MNTKLDAIKIYEIAESGNAVLVRKIQCTNHVELLSLAFCIQ